MTFVSLCLIVIAILVLCVAAHGIYWFNEALNLLRKLRDMGWDE